MSSYPHYQPLSTPPDGAVYSDFNNLLSTLFESFLTSASPYAAAYRRTFPFGNPLGTEDPVPAPPVETLDTVTESTDLSSLSDAQIMALTQNLKDEEATKRPLISSTKPLSTLLSEYTSPIFLSKINWLTSNGWNGLRRTRGDGDCLYRSVAFSYVEQILSSSDLGLAVATSLSHLQEILGTLKMAGFEALVYEDFFDVLAGVINNAIEPDANGQFLTPKTLLERFQDPETSNSIVVFLRLLTSAHIRLNGDDFIPFLFDPETGESSELVRFCETQVEATGKEADHPQILALSRALNVSIDVAYVDGNTVTDKVDFVKFETEGAKGNGTVPITLLYRPGHYDILERGSTE